MKVAIMQPYILPYIGYFQLIESADAFVLYDRIKYTKKGWINRNRFLSNGSETLLSLPLRKDSDFLDIVDREISPDFIPQKLLNQLYEAYRKAPYVEQTMALLRTVLAQDERNLFHYLHNALQATCRHIGIDTPIIVSSTLEAGQELRAQDKVIALCKTMGASTYINPIGGTDLYSHEDFARQGIDLRFLRSDLKPYKQFGDEFVPGLSILDVLMFNSPERVLQMTRTDYELAMA